MATIKLKPVVTLARLREVLDYDPGTGVFQWRITPRRQRKMVGKIAGGSWAKGQYWAIKIDGQRYAAHRLAWLYVYDEWPAGHLDHRDTDGFHNWIDNLREATHLQNMRNKRRYANNSSGYKGVSRHHRKWSARIMIDGKQLFLGVFNTPEEAHTVYVARAVELFGEFANPGA